MASESLKLSDPSDGNRGDDVVDIGIVDILSEETCEIASFSDSLSTSSSPKTVEKKITASVRVKTWWK